MDISIDAVAFNYDPNSTNHDALNIRRNAMEIVRLPEWQAGIAIRPEDSPAAYSLKDVAGKTILVKARFRRNVASLAHAQIRAVADTDDPDVPAECRNPLGTLEAKDVSFQSTGFTAMEAFEAKHHRLDDWGVGVRTATWRWEYRVHHSGPWHHFATTRHRIYSLVSIPTDPWKQFPFNAGNAALPWTDVLDYACWWALEAKTPDKAAGKITKAVNDLGPIVVTYDCPGGGSTHYAWPTFNCTAFVDRLRGGIGNGYYLNCTDCATITSTFANSLGCDLWQSRMGWSFGLNPMLGIGSNVWQPACGWSGFSYHEVAWEGACTQNEDVYDACLQENGGLDPTKAPYVPLLPIDFRFGNPGDNTYRDKLATPPTRGNCNPQPGTRQRRAVS